MPRPVKNTVDYFPHDGDASDGKTLTILFNHFGHEGVAAWWLLLERISRTNNHVIGIGNPEDLEYLAAKLHFTPDRFKEILDKLASLEAIDSKLYHEGLIWSDNFIGRVASVYTKRKQSIPRKPDITTTDNPVTATDNPVSSPDNTQRKVNKIKGNNTILPDWIDRELWDAFMEVRKGKKAPPIEKALNLIIDKLTRLKEAGDDPSEVLKESIMRNWTSVFPLKKGGNYGAPKEPPTESRTELLKRSVHPQQR